MIKVSQLKLPETPSSSHLQLSDTKEAIEDVLAAQVRTEPGGLLDTVSSQSPRIRLWFFTVSKTDGGVPKEGKIKGSPSGCHTPLATYGNVVQCNVWSRKLANSKINNKVT